MASHRGLSIARTSAAVLALALFTNACTWVKLTEQGKAVRVAKPGEVAGCEHLGEASAHVLDKVTFVKRSRDKQAEEVATLARNEAAEMGGDTIVPLSELENGRRSFAVYRCK